MRVKYHEAAEEELLHEIGYLEQRANGLGRRFFAEVQRAENLIAQFPKLGRGDTAGYPQAYPPEVPLLAYLHGREERLANTRRGAP